MRTWYFIFLSKTVIVVEKKISTERNENPPINTGNQKPPTPPPTLHNGFASVPLLIFTVEPNLCLFQNRCAFQHGISGGYHEREGFRVVANRLRIILQQVIFTWLMPKPLSFVEVNQYCIYFLPFSRGLQQSSGTAAN